jgi:tRNA nucleotidyltransferase (CCA-adding enzyme)
MKFIALNKKIQKKVRDILSKQPKVAHIIETIDRAGGKALLVGGAVRDILLGLPVKDLDVEVHQLTLAQLESILKKYGAVSLVGKSYGVLRVHGLAMDWSVPRTEGAGRKPKVSIDPFMSMKEAFRRRDLTINAMGIDLVSFELIDPFKGLQDLEKGILRACDEKKFLEDPLRFFRVMQFIARFNMHPNKKLNDVCKKMSVKKVSVERIDEELRKLFLTSKKPSQAFVWLKKIGRLRDIFPELYNLIGVQQNPDWHPEGDVFEHTMQSIDAAAQLSYENDGQRLLILYAALCHDLGKVEVTEEEEGKLVSRGHSEAGIPLTKKLLRRITRNKELVDSVCTLIKHHMMPGQLAAANAKLPAYKRLARKLAPITLQELALLALADKRGRNPKKGAPLRKSFEDIDLFLKKADEAQVLTAVEKPLLQGRDLLDVIKPGPQMGQMLMEAYELQLEKGIRDKKVLKQQILKKFRVRKKRD